MHSGKTDDGVDKVVNPSRNLTLDGMRVIIMVADLELGGSERQALRTAQYLIKEKNAKVEVWGLGSSVGLVAQYCEEERIPWRLLGPDILGPKDLENYGMNVFAASFGWLVRRRLQAKMLTRLAMTLRRARPDAILPYLILPNVACGLVWRWTGASVCIWNQRDTGFERLSTRIESAAVRRTPWFVANSQAGARFLKQSLGAPPERVRVIHNGIQLAPAQMDRASWRSSLGLKDDTFVACMVANVNSYKDHATLLRAWRHVIDSLEAQGRSAMLLLAGRFVGSTDALKILAFDLELVNQFRFLGPVKDIAGLLAAVDLGVLSSPLESSPNGVLEAMAAGLAVAGTDNSGMREALGREGYQFLSPAGDAEALADRILRLATDSLLRASVGSANRLRVEREFNPRVTGEQMASLIIEGLQERSRG